MDVPAFPIHQGMCNTLGCSGCMQHVHCKAAVAVIAVAVAFVIYFDYLLCIIIQYAIYDGIDAISGAFIMKFHGIRRTCREALDKEHIARREICGYLCMLW